MSKQASALLRIFSLSIILALPGAAQARSEVAFGVLAFGGEQDAHRRWDKVFTALSVAVPDRHFRMVPLTLDDAEEALAARELDFVLTNPGHFQNLMVKHKLAAMASLRTDRPGKPKTGNRYGAVILVRATKDGPRRLADLRGASFGAVAPDAFGGWQLALQTLLRNGLDPARDFTELRFLGFPQSSIVHAILNGEIDAGTVRTGVLESMVATGEIPEDALLVLNPVTVPNFEFALSTALVPEWLVAATPNADPDLRLSVAKALLDIDGSHADLQAWQPPQSFAPVIEVQASIFDARRTPVPPSLNLTMLMALGIMLAAAAALYQAVHRVRPAGHSARPHPSATQENDTLRISDHPDPPITARETQVLELVESGKTTKEIARLLSISPKTVEFHRHNLMKKFKASNMADLVHRSTQLRQTKQARSDQY